MRRASISSSSGSVGKGVGLPVLVELQAVLQVAQELIGRRQARVFGAGEQIFIAQAEQREQRAAVPHPGLAAAVQPLQALHQELDIANAAARQLDIQPGIGALRGQLFMNALARFRDRLHGAEVERSRVDQRLDEFQQIAPRLALAGRDAGLDEHLQLPVAAALLIVVAGAIERDADFAETAVGTQPQIHAVALAFAV